MYKKIGQPNLNIKLNYIFKINCRTLKLNFQTNYSITVKKTKDLARSQSKILATANEMIIRTTLQNKFGN